MTKPKLNHLTYTIYTIDTVVCHAMWATAFLWQEVDQETIFQSLIEKCPSAHSSSLLIECNDERQARRILRAIEEGIKHCAELNHD